MKRASTAPPDNVADLIKQLGGISPRRILLQPPPGQATEKDLLRWLARTNRPCELVDGVLVEKDMATLDSSLAIDLVLLLGAFLQTHPVGFLTGEGGPVKLLSGLVRLPDIALILRDQLQSRARPTTPILNVAPALAVEVLSKGNTRGEMRRKLKEYFLSGVRVVWFVNPRKRTVEVFSAPDRSVTLTEGQSIDGGDILPGLSLPVAQVFAQIPPVPTRPTKKGGTKKKTPRRTKSA